MKQDQQKKHVCKFCNRSFLDGRILGGHMRTHGVRKRPVQEEEFKLENNNMGFEAYGLRENPKKSWKFSGLNQNKPVQENAQCGLCGKEFESMRALHGHLRHHSGKERRRVRCKICNKWFPAARSLAVHMRLHSNESGSISRPNFAEMKVPDSNNLVRKRRSKRMRYGAAANSSLSSLNESISGTDIEEEEIEVARCLMMLSRGVCKRLGGFNSVSESLYDTSFSFASRRLDHNKRTRYEGGDVVFDHGELVEMKKSRKENLVLRTSADSAKSNCSEFAREMPSDVENEVEDEVSTEKTCNSIDLNRAEMDDESGVMLFDAIIEEEIQGETNSRTNEAVPTQNVTAEVVLDLASMGFVKHALSNKGSYDAGGDAELEKDSYNKTTCSDPDSKIKARSLNKNEFKCRICNRMFASYQALGGHQTLHRTIKSCHKLKSKKDQKDIQATLSPEVEATSMIVEPEGAVDSKLQESDGVILACHESTKDEEHKCQIDLKKVLSGQALGGHRELTLAMLPKSTR